MNHILIVGDSFCAPSVDSGAWTNRLSDHYRITNLGQNGIGQYKIHQQLVSTDIKQFVHIVMLVTSPYRIHTEINPFYAVDHTTHPNCDLIYEDVKNKPNSFERDAISWWFEKVLDLEYAKFIHESIILRDRAYINDAMCTVTPITFFPNLSITGVNDFSDIWQAHPGCVNHMSTKGHQKVVERLTHLIDLTLSK